MLWRRSSMLARKDWLKMQERLTALGYRNYSEYLQSPQFAKIRALSLSKSSTRCYCCRKSRELQPHHTAYDRLGNERQKDIVWVCRSCHIEIHELAFRTTLKKAADTLREQHLERMTIPD